jgi:restriction system protein
MPLHIPAYLELMWPTLRAIRDLGHMASLEEIDEQVMAQEGFSEAQLAVLHKDGPRSEIEYRLAWARKTHKLGVRTVTRTVEDIEVDADFFANFTT